MKHPVNVMQRPHLTIGQVRTNPAGERYAFAVLDDGRRAYVAPDVVRDAGITNRDIGEGFKGVITATPERATEFVVMGVSSWDRDAVQVLLPENVEEPIVAQLHALQAALDAIWDLLGYEETSDEDASSETSSAPS